VRHAIGHLENEILPRSLAFHVLTGSYEIERQPEEMMPQAAGPDEELVARAQCYDDAAFTELMHRTAASSLRLATKILRHHHLAEDEVQNARLKAWRHLGLSGPPRAASPQAGLFDVRSEADVDTDDADPPPGRSRSGS